MADFRTPILILAFLALGGAPAAAERQQSGETIEIEGCPAHASKVQLDGGGEDDFLCECDAGFVDVEDGAGVECAEFDWRGFLGFFVEPVCIIAPSVCGRVTDPGSSGEREDDPCRDCADAHARCEIFEVGPIRIACQQQDEGFMDRCRIEEIFACIEDGLSDCETEAELICVERRRIELEACLKEADDKQLDCDADVLVCELEHCPFEDDGEGSAFDSGLTIQDAASAIGGALGGGLSPAVPQSLEFFVGVQSSLSGPASLPITRTLTLPAPIGAQAIQAQEPCTHCGEVLAFAGRGKTRVASLGKRKAPFEMGIRITETGLFEASDRGGHAVAGEWEAANARGNKLALFVDDAFLPSFAGMMEQAARDLDPGAGEVEVSEPPALRLKLRGDGTVAARLRVRFTVLVDGARKPGRFHARLGDLAR